MQTTIKKISAAVSAALLILPLAVWAEDADPEQAARSAEELERRLESASAQLEKAAKKLAEVYTTKYSYSTGGNKAMLGILLGEATPGGVGIVGTTPKGGAAEAGMQAGDLIITIDGKDLSTSDIPVKILSKHMKTVEPGEVVNIEYLREDTTYAVDITTRGQNEHVLAMVDDGLANLNIDIDLSDLPNMAGCDQVVVKQRVQRSKLMEVSGDLAGYFDIEQGVVVMDPIDGSNLKAGDVLLMVGDTEITDTAHAMQLLALNTSAGEVEVKRKGRTRTVTLQPGELVAKPNQKEVHVIVKD